MPLETKGFDGLIGDITKMANALNTDSEGAPAARRILRAAAVPIDAQMKANASRDPKIISGKLRGAISTGNVKKHKPPFFLKNNKYNHPVSSPFH